MILLNASQIRVLQTECAVVSSLSLVASLVIIGTHVSHKHLRSRSAKLVVFLSLSVAGSDLTGLAYLDGGSCSIYGLFTSFFLIAIALWSSTLARTLQLVGLQRSDLHRHLTRLNSMGEDSRIRRKWGLELLRMFAFHLLVWGTAFFCALGIVIISARAPISSWCWFEASNPDNAATTGQLLFFYVPISLALLYNAYVLGGTYLKSWCKERGQQQMDDDDISTELSALSVSLRYYVLFATVLLSLICLAELVNIAAFPRFTDSSPQHFWLYFVIFLLVRLQGVFNLLVYAQREDVRQAWYDFFLRSRPRLVTETSLGGEALDDHGSEFQSASEGKLLVTPSIDYENRYEPAAGFAFTPLAYTPSSLK